MGILDRDPVDLINQPMEELNDIIHHWLESSWPGGEYARHGKWLTWDTEEVSVLVQYGSLEDPPRW